MYHVLFSTTAYYYSSKYLICFPLVVYHIVCRYHFIHSTAYHNKIFQLKKTLVHYDDSKPLYMSCDASSAYGCGRVLFHRINGSERPVAFASCTLTKSQRNYSPLDKEAFFDHLLLKTISSVPIWSFIPHHY